MSIDCYECTGYGDDYYLDENGEWVSACEDCPLTSDFENEEDDDGQSIYAE